MLPLFVVDILVMSIRGAQKLTHLTDLLDGGVGANQQSEVGGAIFSGREP
jgi:hypothetical protein